MKPLSTSLKALIILCTLVVLPQSLATSNKKDVFVTQNHHVIHLGSLVKTLHKSVPVYVYYNQHSDILYYTWYDSYKHRHVLKAYYRQVHKTPHYIATYYGKVYKPYH